MDILTRRHAPVAQNVAFSPIAPLGRDDAASESSRGLPFPIEVDLPSDTGEPVHSAAQQEAEASAQRLRLQRTRLLAHTRLSVGFPSELRSDVVSFKNQIIMEDEDERVDSIVLASRLAAVGYDVVCRRALGAGQSTGPNTAPGACFRLLQYEFLVVKCTKGDFEGLELFVDPYFREQFQIPHPTEHYAKLLESVPVVYVGSRVHLIAIVELLCAEMAESFAARSLTLAPWRRTSAMLSKWLPVHAKDTPFASSFHAPPNPAPDMAAAAAETWMPFGAGSYAAPAPQQQQSPSPPAASSPFAEVRARREQEEMARQMATLETWCNYQASPCVNSPIAAAAAAAMGTGQAVPAPAAANRSTSAPSHLQQQQEHRSSSPSPPPTSPRSCSSSDSSSSRRTSLLSVQLHQQVGPTCVRVPTEPARAVSMGAAHESLPVLRKVQYAQQA